MDMNRIVILLLVIIAPSYVLGQLLDNNHNKKKSLTPSLKDRVYECEGREWGFGIGTSHVKSDIGVQNSPFDGSTNISAHVFFRKRFNPIISLSSVLAYGKISGDDKKDANFEIKERGKNFTNNIVELSGRFELYLPTFKRNKIRRSGLTAFDLYAFGGIGGIYHNPIVNNTNTLIMKQDSSLLRGGSFYSNYQFSFPVGGALSFAFANNMKMGIEMGWRFLLFDYIDGFSPANTTIKNDKYIFSLVNISWFIPKNNKVKKYKNTFIFKK